MTNLRDHYRARRKRFLERHVELATAEGLEIGAFDYPTVMPDEGSCEYADARSREQLAQQFGVPIEQIVPTHHLVTRDRAVSEQISKRFDYVVLCHVLEHIPDVVGYLNELRRLLKPGGVLFLAIPDKRRTEDALRPSTTLDDLLELHAAGATRPTYRQVASFARHWVEDLRKQAEEQPRAFHEWVKTQIETDAADVHCNVWEDRELFEQLEVLLRSEFLEDLSLLGTERNQPPFNEFYVALQRTDGEARSIEAAHRVEAPCPGIYFRSCNFCGSESFRVFKRVDLPFPDQIYGDAELSFPDIGAELTLQYLECTDCGLIFINPLTRFSDIDKNSFDGERNIVAWAESDYATYERDKLEMTRIIYEQYELEKYRGQGRVLDVGCGPGVSLSWLRDQQNWEVYGVDPDLHSQRQARDRYGLTIANGLIHDIELEEESLDLIFMDNSLEHTFDPLAALLKAFRMLRKGGALFLFVPNSDGLSTTHLHANAYWGHWFFYSPRALVRILNEIGFEVPRFIAIQNPANPELANVGVDVERYADELVVRLETDPVVRQEVEVQNIRADFFNLVAVKPADAGLASVHEEALLEIARRSLEERTQVRLEHSLSK